MSFAPLEVVTAAKLNLATGISGDSNTADRTFTNTTFLDLDALTGGAGSMGAVAVTMTTGTTVWVSVTATISNATDTAATVFGFRVSGATTLASTDSGILTATTSARLFTITSQIVVTPLTAGVNTFEMQARVGSGTGRIIRPSLTVMTV